MADAPRPNKVKCPECGEVVVYDVGEVQLIFRKSVGTGGVSAVVKCPHCGEPVSVPIPGTDP